MPKFFFYTVLLFCSSVLPLNASELINLAAGASEHATQALQPRDSWIAIALVLSSLITAAALNYQAPKVRVIGTVLSALGCMAVAAWFFIFVINTGFLENPKPNQTPLDSAKPTLLWLQALVALGAGVMLLLVAFAQSKSQQALTLPAANEEQRYGAVSRFLHWSTAILFIALIPMGIFASIIPEGTAFRLSYYAVHKTLGVVVVLLLIVRVVWNIKAPRPVLANSLNPGERKLAHGAHFVLYCMLFAIPVTGYVMTSYHGYPTYFFAWELQPLWEASDSATMFWGLLHKYVLPYLLYVVLGAHVLGALKHRFLDGQEDGFKRMVG